MFLLDTDTYTHLLMARPTVVRRLTLAVDAGEKVAITIITKFELLQGRMSAVLKADTKERFLAAQRNYILTEEELRKIDILLLDGPVLDQFEELKKTRGLKKIGRADLLIASMARENRATLVTRNSKHFKRIRNLRIENWVD